MINRPSFFLIHQLPFLFDSGNTTLHLFKQTFLIFINKTGRDKSRLDKQQCLLNVTFHSVKRSVQSFGLKLQHNYVLTLVGSHEHCRVRNMHDRTNINGHTSVAAHNMKLFNLSRGWNFHVFMQESFLEDILNMWWSDLFMWVISRHYNHKLRLILIIVSMSDVH